MTTEGFSIKTSEDRAVYEGLRSLWCECFGDEPGYVDWYYEVFGDDVKGYAAVDEEGRVCSALISFLCGTFEGRPAYVTYAVCTAPEYRGRGLAAMLVDHVKEAVLKEGGISIVSPAGPSLEAYYAELGYEPYFWAPRITLLTEDDDEEYEDFTDYDIDIGPDEAFETLVPGISLKAADRDLYNRYREAFLTGRPHVELSDAMLRLVESECDDDGGMFVINGGDAICVINSSAGGSLVMAEFILSPALGEFSLEIDTEIARGAARQYGAYEVTYSMPGSLRCQALAAGVRPIDAEQEGYVYSKAYFGFPIE